MNAAGILNSLLYRVHPIGLQKINRRQNNTISIDNEKALQETLPGFFIGSITKLPCRCH